MNKVISKHFVFVFVFVLITGFLFLPNITHAGVITMPPNSLGLVGYWSFEDVTNDDSIKDFSGNNYNLSISGFNEADNHISGYKSSSSALDFDGVDDYLIVPNLGISGTNDFTISFWINTVTPAYGPIYATDNLQLIVGKYILDAGKIYFSINAGGSFIQRLSTADIDDGLWHLVTVVRSGGNSLDIYTDGVLTNGTLSNPENNPSLTSSTALIGKNGTEYKDISLDDFRVYSRALSASEVQTLYKRTISKSIDKSNLVGYWSFEDARGTQATDFSGNGNHGTLNGAMTDSDWVNGRVGKALDFDGSSNYISTPPLTFGLNQTVSVWVKLDSIPSTVTIFGACTDTNSACTGGDADQSTLRILSDGTIRYGRNEYNGSGSNYYEQSDTTINTGEWVHITATYTDPGNTNEDVTIFINGSEAATSVTSDSDPPTASFDSVAGIGARFITFGSQYDQHVDGLIDELRVYDAVLTATEIQNIYSSSKYTKINSSQNSKITDGLVGMWSFNGPDVTPTLAKDSSGNGNDGTRNGGVAPTIGKVGQAFSFDGVDDYVDLPIDLSVYNSGSVSFWLKVRANDVTDGCVFCFSRKADATRSEFRVHLDQLSGSGLQRIYAIVYTGGATQWQITVPESTYNTTNDFGWHHIVVTQNGISPVFYLDGISVGSLSGPNQGAWFNDTTADEARINAFPLNGLENENRIPTNIDELRIYDKALTSAEVLRLYRLGR